MPWTRLSLPHPPSPTHTSASCHSKLMTGSILPLSPQSHKDLILSSHSEHRIKQVHCYVCVYICVCLIRYVTPCWGKVCMCVQASDCVSAIWQASLLERSLSDCWSIRQAPILRKACGLGRPNKYTRRKSQLLTPGQWTLRSSGCVEYRSKSVIFAKTINSQSWCKIQQACLDDWYWSISQASLVSFELPERHAVHLEHFSMPEQEDTNQCSPQTEWWNEKYILDKEIEREYYQIHH